MSHHSITPARFASKKHLTSFQRHTLPQRHFFLQLLILITIFLSIATATSIEDEAREKRVEREIKSADLLGSTLARLARSGTIITDRRPPPQKPQFPEIALEKRSGSTGTAESSSSHTSSATRKSSSTTEASTTSAVASSTTSSGLAVATQTSSALPSPFDTALGSNFTNNACPLYIKSFIEDEDFKTCLPFSLLLQSSNSFFQAEKSVVRITQTLDHSCSANITFCNTLMQTIAHNLTQSTYCGADLTAQQPLVKQAYVGLLAYSPLYTVSCLRNPSTSAYCFADAITNSSSPTDSYVYYLPLNVSLPGGSQPTCSSCLQNTMAVYEAASANRSQAIASTYSAAAQQINVQCGPLFVNASVAAVASSAAAAVAAAGLSRLAWTTVVLVLLSSAVL